MKGQIRLTETATTAISINDFRQFKYPNIAAEQIESGAHIESCYIRANVTPELWDAIMRGDDDFTASEMIELCRHFHTHRIAGPGYLASPQLSTVKPNTHKGRLRLLALEARILSMQVFLAPCKPDEIGGYFQEKINQANRTYATMATGEPVTYAAYRHALHNTSDVPSGIQAFCPRPPRGITDKGER